MNSLLIAGLGIASVIDWKTRKIPNWLTLSMSFTGLLFQIYSLGSHGLIQAILGFMLGILLLYMPFALGGIGGGDVKLLAAIGTFTGPLILFQVFLASAVFGGIFSLIEVIRKKAVKKTFENLKQRILFAVLRQRICSESEISFTSKPIRIPYALTICCGYLCIHFWGGH